ncbi:MAG: NAD-dependent epimerase/dehydratase family protein [Rhabdochlamydiaceae bacterium]
MKRVMILGLGYLGQHLVKRLMPPYEVLYGSTTSSDKLVDLAKLGLVPFVFKSTETSLLQDKLLHTDVLIVCVAPKSKDKYQEAYLDLACVLREKLKQISHPLQVVYISSTSVYENAKSTTEDTELHPLSENINILVQTEKVYESLSSEYVSVLILRLAGLYGIGREIEKRVLLYEKGSIPGDPYAYTNHIHVEDVVRAVQFLLERKSVGLFNVVNDSHPTRLDLYTNIAKKLGIASLEWQPAQKTIHGQGRIVVNDKIKEKGFIFEYDNLEIL